MISTDFVNKKMSLEKSLLQCYNEIITKSTLNREHIIILPLLII